MQQANVVSLLSILDFVFFEYTLRIAWNEHVEKLAFMRPWKVEIRLIERRYTSKCMDSLLLIERVQRSFKVLVGTGAAFGLEQLHNFLN